MERSKLRIPARGLLLNDVHVLLAIVFRAEVSQCFDDRIIGFLAGKTFHTLTTGDVPLAFITQVAAEEIDERSFPHTGLTSYKGDLTIALGRLLEQSAQALQFLLPPNDGPGLRPTSIDCVPFGLFSLPQEPVAASGTVRMNRGVSTLSPRSLRSSRT